MLLDSRKKYEKVMVRNDYIKPALCRIPRFKVGQRIHIKEIAPNGLERAKWRKGERTYMLHDGKIVEVYKDKCIIQGKSGYKECINYRDIQTNSIEIEIL